MSVPQSKVPNIPNIPPQSPERKVAECDKNSEIEKIKRQIYNVLEKLESLKEK